MQPLRAMQQPLPGGAMHWVVALSERHKGLAACRTQQSSASRRALQQQGQGSADDFARACGASPEHASNSCGAALCAGNREAGITYLTLIPIAGGVIIATGGEPSFHLFGFAACLLATSGRALKSVVQVSAAKQQQRGRVSCAGGARQHSSLHRAAGGMFDQQASFERAFAASPPAVSASPARSKPASS